MCRGNQGAQPSLPDFDDCLNFDDIDLDSLLDLNPGPETKPWCGSSTCSACSGSAAGQPTRAGGGACRAAAAAAVKAPRQKEHPQSVALHPLAVLHQQPPAAAAQRPQQPQVVFTPVAPPARGCNPGPTPFSPSAPGTSSTAACRALLQRYWELQRQDQPPHKTPPECAAPTPAATPRAAHLKQQQQAQQHEQHYQQQQQQAQQHEQHYQQQQQQAQQHEQHYHHHQQQQAQTQRQQHDQQPVGRPQSQAQQWLTLPCMRQASPTQPAPQPPLPLRPSLPSSTGNQEVRPPSTVAAPCAALRATRSLSSPKRSWDVHESLHGHPPGLPYVHHGQPATPGSCGPGPERAKRARSAEGLQQERQAEQMDEELEALRHDNHNLRSEVGRLSRVLHAWATQGFVTPEQAQQFLDSATKR